MLPDLELRLGTRHGNNLDFIRFFAATLVIVAHTFDLLGRSKDPWANLVHDQTLGHLGVSIFFFVSGLLITRSWLRGPSVRSFLVRRASRIFPGLAVASLFCVFVVGPLATTWPLDRYFSRWDTYFFLFNAFGLPPHYFLPGTFNGNVSHVVNGSLWTLPTEILCYLAVLVTGRMGLFSPRRFPLALLGFAAALLWPYFAYLFFLSGGATWWQLRLMPADRLFFDFLLGSLAYVYRDKIILHRGIAWCVLALVAATIFNPTGYFVRLFGLPYLILYAVQARTPWLHSWGKHGDLSYGLYIYAFPVQQLIISQLGVGIPGWLLFSLSLSVTVGLALLSWRWVEQPALVFARRYRPRSHGMTREIGSSGFIGMGAEPIPSVGKPV